VKLSIAIASYKRPGFLARCFEVLSGRSRPADVVDLATKLGFLLDRPALAREMGRRGRVLVERYSLRRHVEKTLAVYERAVASSRRGYVGTPS